MEIPKSINVIPRTGSLPLNHSHHDLLENSHRAGSDSRQWIKEKLYLFSVYFAKEHM